MNLDTVRAMRVLVEIFQSLTFLKEFTASIKVTKAIVK